MYSGYFPKIGRANTGGDKAQRTRAVSLYHVHVDETLYVMEGSLNQLYGDETRELRAGDFYPKSRGFGLPKPVV